jgi:CO/xanthine dehydrogenase FAD-binding subunit
VFRIPAAEAKLEGKPASVSLIDEASDAAANNIQAAGDLHADEAYRRDVTSTLARRMLREACARAGLTIDG